MAAGDGSPQRGGSQPWSRWAEQFAIKSSDAEREAARPKDAKLFDFYPGAEKFSLVVCRKCKTVVRLQNIRSHFTFHRCKPKAVVSAATAVDGLTAPARRSTSARSGSRARPSPQGKLTEHVTSRSKAVARGVVSMPLEGTSQHPVMVPLVVPCPVSTSGPGPGRTSLPRQEKTQRRAQKRPSKNSEDSCDTNCAVSVPTGESLSRSLANVQQPSSRGLVSEALGAPTTRLSREKSLTCPEPQTPFAKVPVKRILLRDTLAASNARIPFKFSALDLSRRGATGWRAPAPSQEMRLHHPGSEPAAPAVLFDGKQLEGNAEAAPFHQRDVQLHGTKLYI